MQAAHQRSSIEHEESNEDARKPTRSEMPAGIDEGDGIGVYCEEPILPVLSKC